MVAGESATAAPSQVTPNGSLHRDDPKIHTQRSISTKRANLINDQGERLRQHEANSSESSVFLTSPPSLASTSFEVEHHPQNPLGSSPADMISSAYIGWKHDAKRYTAAVPQIIVLAAWLTIGVIVVLRLTIWAAVDSTQQQDVAWVNILRAASFLVLPSVVFLFIAFAFFPYTGINPKRITDWDTPLCFRWTTRGTNPNLIRNVVSKSYDTIHKFGNFFIEVCTETSVKEIPENVDPSVYKEIVIPKEYEAPLGSKFRSRALHYGALNSHAPADAYIVHLDEESVVTEELLLGIREFISHNKNHIGQGIVTYAREAKGWQSWVAWIMDAVRVDDYGRFRMKFLIGRVMVGTKDSFMVVPRQMELGSGFDHESHSPLFWDGGFTLRHAEKVRFCPGRLVKLSPFNLRDTIRQRRNWASTTWKVLFHNPTLTWFNKVTLTYQMLAWLMAPLIAISVFAGLALSNYKESTLLSVYNGIALGIFNFQYFWGILNLESNSMSGKLFAILLAPFLLPIFIIIEAAAGCLGTFVSAKESESDHTMNPVAVSDTTSNSISDPLKRTSPARKATVRSIQGSTKELPTTCNELTPPRTLNNGEFLVCSSPLAMYHKDVNEDWKPRNDLNLKPSLETTTSRTSPLRHRPSTTTLTSRPFNPLDLTEQVHCVAEPRNQNQPLYDEISIGDTLATAAIQPQVDLEATGPADSVKRGPPPAKVYVTKGTNTVRDIHLDGLRGVCVLVIMAHHIVDCTFGDTNPELKNGKLQIFWSTWALQIFFLLTGRVLSRGWIKSVKAGNPNFEKLANLAFRRPFRLFIPTFIIVFLQWKCAKDGWFGDADNVFYNMMGSRSRGFPGWGKLGDSFFDVVVFMLQMANGNIPAAKLLDHSSAMWAMWTIYVGSVAVFFMLATYPFIKRRRWLFLLGTIAYFYWIQSLLTVFLLGIVMAELSRMGLFSNIYNWPRHWNHLFTLAIIGLFLSCYWSDGMAYFLNSWCGQFWADQSASWLTPTTPNYLLTPHFPMVDVTAAVFLYISVESSVTLRFILSSIPLQWLGQVSMAAYLFHEFLIQMVVVRIIKRANDNGLTNHTGLCLIFWASTYAVTLAVASVYKVAVEDRLDVFVPWLYNCLLVNPWSFKHLDSAVADHVAAFPRVAGRWLVDVLTLGYYGYIKEIPKSIATLSTGM